MSDRWSPSGPAASLPRVAELYAPARSCPPVLPSSVTILLVDDDPMVREVMADTLAELGHRLVVCPDGPTCLEALNGLGGVTVLVTDVLMPGMSGVALADAYRRARPGSPVVFATGVADSTLPVGPLGPADLLLTKPFGGAALLAAVEQATGLAKDLSGRFSRRASLL